MLTAWTGSSYIKKVFYKNTKFPYRPSRPKTPRSLCSCKDPTIDIKGSIKREGLLSSEKISLASLYPPSTYYHDFAIYTDQHLRKRQHLLHLRESSKNSNASAVLPNLRYTLSSSRRKSQANSTTKATTRPPLSGTHPHYAFSTP